ncbi:MAG: sulfite exporter TauE/SafE family protein [Candidatus Bathyarchaeota archaeon]|nr:sulfite exporter TauE/SafE family protein [Candidatus Bathyarchaeota archaeon]
MSVITQISNPYLEAFAVGILYGLVFCTSSCLPYLASYIAGIGAGFRKATTVTLVFNSGRLTAYAIIGAAIAVLSGAFGFLLTETALAPIQQYSSYAFGVITMLIGVSIYLKSRRSQPCQNCGSTVVESSRWRRWGGFDSGAFVLGLSRGLVLCPPLMLLLIYTASFVSPAGSVAVAVLFGLGTTLSPILLLGGVTGWLLNKAPLFRKWVSLAGAAVMVVLGVITIISGFTV